MNLGAKSGKLLLSLPVVLIAILIHFIVYISRYSWQTGFISGLASAVGYIILTAIVVSAYTIATKAKENLLSGYLYALTILIIAGLIKMGISALPISIPYVVF